MSRPLVISDGSIPGIVACAIEAERSAEGPAPLVWAGDLLGSVPRQSRAAAQQAVQTQGGLLGLEAIDEPWVGGEGTSPEQSLALLHVSQHAASIGVRRVVWAVQFPLIGAEPDLDRIASTVDRCLLVSRLVSLDLWDHPDPKVPEVRVETPLVDLSDAQVSDLALDLGAPVGSVWWMDGYSDAARRQQERWGPVLARLGWGAHPGFGVPCP